MPEIRVSPGLLERAGGTLTVGADELHAARATLARVVTAGEATGSAGASASYARMHATWSEAIGILGELAQALGGAAGQAAADYTATDRSVIPGPGLAP